MCQICKTVAIAANSDKVIIATVGHNCPRTQHTVLSVDVTNTKRACGGVVGVSPSTRYVQYIGVPGSKARSDTSVFSV
jgi:hypothetical protein